MHKAIHIIGLGADRSPELPETIRASLNAEQTVFSKFLTIPILTQTAASVKYVSPIINPTDELTDGYRGLAAELARSAPAVYLVPGDPLLDEASLPAIREAAARAGVTVTCTGGPDLLSQALRELRLSPGSGLQIVDATLLCSHHYPPLEPHRPALITGLYHPNLLPLLKRRLRAVYPPRAAVRGWSPAGPAETTLADADETFTHLYLPPPGDRLGLTAFQETIAHLRAPNGCPWDREQTHRTLRPYLLEETYEVLAALDADNPIELADELGDLLLQIILHAQIAAEADEFVMAKVIDNINRKIVRRHPHVFGEATARNAEEVKVNWATIKAREKAEKGEAAAEPSALDGVQRAMPALAQAMDISQKAVRVGFEWETMDGVLKKLVEEAHEIAAAANPAEVESEVGDFLFVAVNLARKLKVDPESALRATNARFIRRFQKLEALARERNLSLPKLDKTTWQSLWEEAKKAVAHLE